jgi:hypothetical protein
MLKKCNSCSNINIWIFKIFMLIILILIFYLSILYYYKSLNNIKHNESKGL